MRKSKALEGEPNRGATPRQGDQLKEFSEKNEQLRK